jgi:hypothetical protein
MVAGSPPPHDRGVAHRCVGADDTGQGREAQLVYAEDGLRRRRRPLLLAGQVSSRHWAIAPSSRWRARRAGCCGLHRMAWQRRPTCRGWEEIPYSS